MSRNISHLRIAKKKARKKKAVLPTGGRTVEQIFNEIFARGNVVAWGSSSGDGDDNFHSPFVIPHEPAH